MDVALGRDIGISDRETAETIMRKQTSLVNNRPTLKVLRHIERKKLIEEVHHLDKVLLSMQVKNITELDDTILRCGLIVKQKSNRAK